MFAISIKDEIVEVKETYVVKQKGQREGVRCIVDTDGKSHYGLSCTYFETEEQAEEYLDILAEKNILRSAYRNAMERLDANCRKLALEQPAYDERVYRSNLKRYQRAGRPYERRASPNVEIYTLIHGPVDEIGKEKVIGECDSYAG